MYSTQLVQSKAIKASCRGNKLIKGVSHATRIEYTSINAIGYFARGALAWSMSTHFFFRRAVALPGSQGGLQLLGGGGYHGYFPCGVVRWAILHLHVGVKTTSIRIQGGGI